MTISKSFVTTLILTFATAGILHAQDNASTIDDELHEIRQQLVDRLSPAEADLLKRTEQIENEIKKQDPWLQPPVILAIVVAAAGWVIAIVQNFVTRNQRTWELLLESLRWFEGGTQPRSIGIALVESKWDHHKEFRRRWTSILVNQAIYLLTRKKGRDAIHERANLYRIMKLLIETVGPSGNIEDIERELISETLNQYDPDSGRGLKNLEKKRLESWRQYFC
jgi:hypothetical protein